MVDIRPQDLNPAVTPIDADSPIIIDQGLAGVNRTTSAAMVNAVAPVVSQSEAEVGTDDVKRMTALKTKQSIASEVGLSVASYAAGQAGLSAVQSVNGKSGNAVTLVKADVGLSNVDNTSDANKPISTATQTALNLKANTSTQVIAGDGLTGGGTLAASRTLALNSTSIASLAKADTAVQSVNGKSGSAVALVKGDVGLGNVDNTPDLAKPISTATQTALNAKANNAITVTTGAGLTGGGNLTANRTVALNAASIASLAKADTAVQPAGLTKAAVGLGNVDNTSDANKPISTATQTALNGKASTAAVTTTVNGLMIAADKVKLNGIAAGAQVNVPQVQTDWDAITGLGSILNKPSLGAMAAKNNVAISDISSTGTPNSGNFLRGDGTWSPVAGAGTVTSVAMTVPTGLSIAGSPITGAGTLAVSYASGYQGYTTAEASKLNGLIETAVSYGPQTLTAPQQGQARNNIGLGNSATRDVGEGQDDVMSGSPDKIEVNRFGTGDRASFIDFHAAGAPDASDYHARIIRNPGVNGDLVISTTGAGTIVFGQSPVVGSQNYSVYHSGNILGTLSQSGGVPTGAIIERGSNANGEYVKYADGTLICWFTSLLLTYASPEVLIGTWTYPAGFVTAPACVPTNLLGHYSGTPPINSLTVQNGATGTTTHNSQLRRMTSSPNFISGDTATFATMAIGRWF